MNTTNHNLLAPNSPQEVRPNYCPETAMDARGNMGESETQCQSIEAGESTVAQSNLVLNENRCNYCHINQCLLEDEENKLIELLQYNEQKRAIQKELDEEYEKLQYLATEVLRLLTSYKDQKQLDPIPGDTD